MKQRYLSRLGPGPGAVAENIPFSVLIVGMVLFIGYGAVDAISSPGTQFENAPTIEIGQP